MIEMLKSFIRDKNGQVATTFALCSLPILIGTTLAIDVQRAQSSKTQLMSSLDAAALAAIIRQDLSNTERQEYAIEFFHNMAPSEDGFSVKVVGSDDETLTLQGGSKIETTLAGIVGKNRIANQETVTSEPTKQHIIIYLLALDPNGARSLEVTKGATFGAPTCSVQVNSTHQLAAVTDHGGQAMAKDFCVSGKASGRFEPHMNTSCGQVEDPYADLAAPAYEKCIDPLVVQKTLSQWQANSHEHGVVLEPGVYCGGLELVEKVVYFSPGTYVMKDGPLFLGLGSKVVAKDVTFVMQGDDSYLDIDRGSSFEIKAPRDGRYAGLAFFQDRRSLTTSPYNYPNTETVIRSGGNLRITGTAYFPTQKIRFIGGSILASQAPSTSFTAYNLSFDDGAKIEVAVNHVSAGLPPILTRSDEGARLVR